MKKTLCVFIFLIIFYYFCSPTFCEHFKVLSKEIKEETKAVLPAFCSFVLTAGKIEVFCEVKIPFIKGELGAVYAKRLSRESALYNARNYMYNIIYISNNYVLKKEGITTALQLSPYSSALTSKIIDDYQFENMYVIRLSFPIFWKNAYTNEIISELIKFLE